MLCSIFVYSTYPRVYVPPAPKGENCLSIFTLLDLHTCCFYICLRWTTPPPPPAYRTTCYTLFLATFYAQLRFWRTRTFLVRPSTVPRLVTTCLTIQTAVLPFTMQTCLHYNFCLGRAALRGWVLPAALQHYHCVGFAMLHLLFLLPAGHTAGRFLTPACAGCCCGWTFRPGTPRTVGISTRRRSAVHLPAGSACHCAAPARICVPLPAHHLLHLPRDGLYWFLTCTCLLQVSPPVPAGYTAWDVHHLYVPAVVRLQVPPATTPACCHLPACLLPDVDNTLPVGSPFYNIPCRTAHLPAFCCVYTGFCFMLLPGTTTPY